MVMLSKITWRRGVFACLALALVAAPSAAADQSSNSRSPLYHNPGYQCSTGVPSITDFGSGVSGNAVAHRNPDGTVTINVEISNGFPNTTYYPNILCNRWFGVMTTDSYGDAAGHFVLPSDVPQEFTVSVEAGFDPAVGWVGPLDSDTSAVMSASSS